MKIRKEVPNAESSMKILTKTNIIEEPAATRIKNLKPNFLTPESFVENRGKLHIFHRLAGPP